MKKRHLKQIVVAYVNLGILTILLSTASISANEIRQGKRRVFLGCPITAELPQGEYALLSEAGLYNYIGMTLRPTRTCLFQVSFEDDPKGFILDGPIVSPWRVTIITENLNDLVNSDLIPNLCEPPDTSLFPDGIHADWIQPGKGLITWRNIGLLRAKDLD